MKAFGLDTVAGAAILVLVTLTALASLVWTPHDPVALDIAHRLRPPSSGHLFGTDSYGRDVLSIVMSGSRTALGVALAACLVGMGLGVPLGLYAAAEDGLLGEAIQRAGDIVFAFPALLIAVLIAAVAGPGAFDAIAAIGLFNIPVFARMSRASALRLWPAAFTLAARAAGKPRWRISIEHILPNIAGLLLIQGAIQLSVAILAEAGLAYIGLGVQAPTPSWGRMLGEAQTLAGRAPWLVVFPGVAIVLAVLGLNLLADGLGRRLDPRRRGQAIAGIDA